MKKLCTLILAVIFCLGLSVPAFAEGTEGKTNVLKGVFPEDMRTRYVPDDPEFSGIKVSDEMKKSLKELIDSNILILNMILSYPGISSDWPGYIPSDPDFSFKLNLEKFPTFQDLEDFMKATYTERVVNAFFEQGEYVNNNGELWIKPNKDFSCGEYSIYEEYKVIVVELTEDHCYFDLDVPQYEEFTGEGISQAKVRYEAVKENGEWKLTDVFLGARLYEDKVKIDGIYFYNEQELPDDPTVPTTTEGGNKTPDTADEMSILPFAAAAVLAMIAMAFVMAQRRSSSKQK